MWVWIFTMLGTAILLLFLLSPWEPRPSAVIISLSAERARRAAV
jgi:hypothetical protein